MKQHLGVGTPIPAGWLCASIALFVVWNGGVEQLQAEEYSSSSTAGETRDFSPFPRFGLIQNNDRDRRARDKKNQAPSADSRRNAPADYYNGGQMTAEEKAFYNRFPMPSFQNSEPVVISTDPNAPTGGTGRNLKNFTPTGPPPQLNKPQPAPKQKKVTPAEPRDNSSFYAAKSGRSIPSFQADSWQEGGDTYVEGAPMSGRGRSLQPFGSTAEGWVAAKNAPEPVIEVDMSGVADAERDGSDQVGVEKEPGGPRPRSIFAVANRVTNDWTYRDNMVDEELEGELAMEEEGEIGSQSVEEPTLDDTPIVEELKGIQLISAWEKNRQPAEDEVVVERSELVRSAPESETLMIDPDLEVPQDVRTMFAGQIGQPLSLASLDTMMREAIVGYQGSDIPVVDIAIPEQEITDGILRLDVLEARMGSKLVEDAENPEMAPKHTDPDYMIGRVSTDEGDKLRSSELLDDVAWLNRYPFRRVDLVYTPGEDFGETDVVLRTVTRKPWLFYTGIDNTGNEILGEYRWNSNLTLGNPFGFNDHLAAYQFSTDTEFDHVTSHSFVYTLPVYWEKIRPERNHRHMLTIIGAYADVTSDLQIGSETLTLDGFSAQSSLRYLIPIKRTSDVTHELEFGYDWKASNNNLEFNTFEVFDTTTHIHQISAGWNSRYEQFLGLMGFANLDFDVVFSPGDLSDENSDETFQLARDGATSDYVYARGTVEWHVPLNTWELVASLTGQWSGSNLLATETLGAGGYEDVRGFEERAARGDRGLKGSVELRTPKMVVPSFLDNGRRTESWQGLAFFDWAHLENVERLPGEASARSMSSTGVGLRYEFDQHFDLGVDYGWVIDASGFENPDPNRVHFRGRVIF